MDLKRKNELLLLADSIAKDVNNQGCGNYIPKVINAVKISSDKHDKKIFLDVLKKMENTSFGGQAQKQGYHNFVNEIIRNPRYRITTLDFVELDFVFSWVRRLVKEDSKKTYTHKNNNQSYYSSRKIRNKYNNNGNFSNPHKYGDTDTNVKDNPFAELLKLKL